MSPNVNKLLTDIAIYQIEKTFQHKYLILSISGEIDAILLENEAEEKYHIAIEKLKINKDAYELIFGNEVLIEFLCLRKPR
jgi:hypothetical protein